jgi:Uncharacterised protein family (UPF0236).
MIARIDLGVLEIDLAGLSGSQADARLHECIRERERAAFASLCAQREAASLSDRHCACGGEYMIKDRRVRTVSTLGGEVGVVVRRLRCPVCGRQVRPLDAFLPPARRHTLAVVEAGLYLATDLSYEKASAALEKLTGAKISHGQLQRLAKAEGLLVGTELHEAARDLYECGLDPKERVTRTAEDTLVIAIDGGAIPDRATKDDFEAKVAVLYGIKAEVSKNRVALVDRAGYAGLEDSALFAQRVSTLAIQHGMLSAGRVLAIGDGAGWIRRMIRDYLPGSIYLLDLFHLKKRLREVLSEDRDAGLLEQVTSACAAGDPDGALGMLKTWSAPSAEKAELHRKLCYYIRTNAEGIRNYVRSDLFGSGSVEKAVDLIVSRRFHGRGMSWYRPGALGILKLRMLRFNGEWDQHWAGRLAAA